MAGILNHLVAPLGHGVLCNDPVVPVDLEAVCFNHNLHGFSKKDRRHTVAVGVYVDPGVGGDLAQETAEAEVGGVVSDRSQRHLLRSDEPLRRALMCGPMCALVGDIYHPLLQMAIKVGVVLEGKAAQGVALNEAASRQGDGRLSSPIAR